MRRSIELIIKDGIRQAISREIERQREEETLRQKRKWIEFEREEEERRLREPGEC